MVLFIITISLLTASLVYAIVVTHAYTRSYHPVSHASDPRTEQKKSEEVVKWQATTETEIQRETVTPEKTVTFTVTETFHAPPFTVLETIFVRVEDHSETETVQVVQVPTTTTGLSTVAFVRKGAGSVLKRAEPTLA